MPDRVPVRRALLSVSDKTGLLDLAQALAAHGIEILSTGGTARILKEAGLAVKDVAEHTGFAEMMDGRVKTLHPAIHGGLLARRDDPAHQTAMAENGIAPIDLLVVNLYPFEATVAAGAGEAECIENIDIGGPAMIRSAAKNHAFVTVVTDPADYDAVREALATHDGATPLALRRRLAARAFARTAAYDAAIANWFQHAADDLLPARFLLAGERLAELRYGENPHQRAALYRDPLDPVTGIVGAEQVQGKALSYNNINDTDAALELIADLDPGRPAVAIIKHANPCGVAYGASLEEAYRKALTCDPVSAFGGIVALNRPLDGPTASAIAEIFTEVIIAPGADEAARAALAKKRNLRLLLLPDLPDPDRPGRILRPVSGGFLVQDRDRGRLAPDALKVVTRRAPTAGERDDLLFAFTVAKHVKSNAIVY
ncbi:MAG: bifunctional phosphoribosylaminoimidazolecarboxamide formyltransferase/IMP cyclohydrolase, partial [Rhodothalassiaceae bacterium]